MKLSFKVIFKNAFSYGLILGGIFVIVSLLIYITDVNIFSIWFSILNFLIIFIALPVILVILGTNNLRINIAHDRTISYLDALINCFIILFIGFFISVLYSYIFNQWIDPEYMKHNIDKFITMMEGYNVSQEDIDDGVAKIENNLGMGRQMISSVIICVVLSAIMALIVRKKDKISDKIY